MKLNYNILLFCISITSLLFSSCQREDDKKESPILFGVPQLEVQTKSPLDANTLKNTKVYAFGKRNNTIDVYQGTPLTRNGVNGIWYPSSAQNWNSGTYTFRGVASSATISSISTGLSPSAGSLATPGLEVYNSGLSIKVNQPVSYNESGMIDFLLSKVFSVADGNTKPLVTLEMQHSMPAVEIYVIKAEAIYEACLKSITFTGFYTSGTMTCSSPISYGTNSLHSWSTNLSGSKNANYSITGNLTDNKISIENEKNSTEAVMKIITMPQQLSKDAVLTITYWINERTASSPDDNYKEYSNSFEVYNFVPQNYVAGHKIIYTLKVDSGIHLTGTIEEWKDIDYIEGTILPAV